MPAVAPNVLDSLSRLIGRSLVQRSVGALFQRLTQTRLPVVSADRFAAESPDHAAAHDGDPLVIRFAREGVVDGPLAGEAVVVKDSIDVAGTRTGMGLERGGEIATRDAVMVRRIREAGGYLAGKTKMTELGMDGLGAVIYRDMPANPRAPGYFPGGSSTGTAVAVAAGLARYGVGGDGMGSVRIPAAFCGLVGLKATHGRLPEEGYPSVAPSMDVPGPMARTAADCALLWQVIAGEPVTPLAARAPSRVGVVTQLGPEMASRSIRKAFHRVIARLGARIERADVPGAEHNAILGMAMGTHEVSRSAHVVGELSAAGRFTMAIGRAIDDDLAELLRQRRSALREATLRAIDRTGVLVMPTTAVPAPAVTRSLFTGAQDGLLMRAVGAYTPLANCTGLPAIAVPCGVDDRGRPLSIMFVGAPGSEEELLCVALAVEETGVGDLPV